MAGEDRRSKSDIPLQNTKNKGTLGASRCRRQQEELTRTQVLIYIAEMSDELSTLAKNVKCANLANRLTSAAGVARREMLENRRPFGSA